MLKTGEALTLADNEADLLVEKFGLRGVAEQYPEEGLEETTARARQARLDFLDRSVNGFREHNAIRRASGLEILMPRRQHREWLKEMKALQQVMTPEDQELLAAPTRSSEKVEDVAMQALEQFGITRENAPLAPGLQGLTDIEGL